MLQFRPFATSADGIFKGSGERLLSEQAAVPMIVVTHSQDHVEAINSTLRNAGHPVHCAWIPDVRDLADALSQINPEMLLIFAGKFEIGRAHV